MAFDPDPLDVVLPAELVEAQPEVLILHRLLVGGAPAAPLPVVDPGADAALHVLRIGVQPDAGGLAQRFQRADDRGQLHAVVRGLLLAAGELARPAPRFEQRAPSGDSGVALAGTVRVDLHHACHGSSVKRLRAATASGASRTFFGAGARPLPGTRRSDHCGMMMRIPATRFTACRK